MKSWRTDAFSMIKEHPFFIDVNNNCIELNRCGNLVFAQAFIKNNLGTKHYYKFRLSYNLTTREIRETN